LTSNTNKKSINVLGVICVFSPSCTIEGLACTLTMANLCHIYFVCTT